MKDEWGFNVCRIQYITQLFLKTLRSYTLLTLPQDARYKVVRPQFMKQSTTNNVTGSLNSIYQS